MKLYDYHFVYIRSLKRLANIISRRLTAARNPSLRWLLSSFSSMTGDRCTVLQTLSCIFNISFSLVEFFVGFCSLSRTVADCWLRPGWSDRLAYKGYLQISDLKSLLFRKNELYWLKVNKTFGRERRITEGDDTELTTPWNWNIKNWGMNFQLWWFLVKIRLIMFSVQKGSFECYWIK